VNRRDEPVELWSEQGASEARLKALPRPPRVLHLATHGFYRAADRPQDRPMLLAGVALALGRGRPDDPAGIWRSISPRSRRHRARHGSRRRHMVIVEKAESVVAALARLD